MRILLDEETTAFFKRLDEQVSQSPEDPEGTVAAARDGRPRVGGSSNVKVFVVLAGSPLTKLTVVANGRWIEAKGWAFLKDYLDSDGQLLQRGGQDLRPPEVHLAPSTARPD
jgi:hypothetical protein